jgi:hypothetical protein
MTEINCETVSLAAMAIADGHESALSAEEIEAHRENCSDCRQETLELQALSSLLDAQKRQQQVVDIWPSVETRLPDLSAGHGALPHRLPLMVLGVLLLGYRLVEMLPNRDLAWLFKLVPVIFVVAAFMYLRENPFKINAELRFEGE